MGFLVWDHRTKSDRGHDGMIMIISSWVIEVFLCHQRPGRAVYSPVHDATNQQQGGSHSSPSFLEATVSFCQYIHGYSQCDCHCL